MSKKLRNEQVNEMIALYEKGESALKLSQKFSITPTSIYGLLRRRGIERRTYSEASRKYDLDETYFDQIDCPNKAYFFGFLMADGYNNEKRGVIELSCSEKDREILEKLSLLIKSSKPIRLVESKGIRSCRIDLCSRGLSSKLKALGCMQNKSLKIKFPSLGKELVRHFIRGYFDGDGCISYTYAIRGNVFGNSFNAVITFVSTEEFCLYLKHYLKEKIKINSSILCRHPSHNNTNRTLQISGSLQVIRLMKWMYEGSEIYLDRKMSKFLDLQNRLNSRKDSMEQVKSERKDLIRIGNIIKTEKERWNARYLITHNLIEYKERSYLTEEQALALRKKLDEYGDKDIIPEDTVCEEFFKARKAGFPYYKFSNEHIVKRVRSIVNFHPLMKEGLFNWDGFGTEIANYFHPQMFECRKKGKISALDFFNSDQDLKRGMYKLIALYPKITESNIREICCNETASSRINNFPPRVMMTVLNALFSSKQKITVLDPCAGFSGRLLGCYGSGIVKKYIGIDLSPKTYDGLIRTKEIINDLNEDFEIDIKKGSCLDILPIEEKVDLVFTSPPFLDEEEYVGVSVERDYEIWKQVFIKPFILKSYASLKDGGLLSVYTEAFRRNDFPLDFCGFAKEVGFERLDDINFKMPTRESLRRTSTHRVVKVLVFQK